MFKKLLSSTLLVISIVNSPALAQTSSSQTPSASKTKPSQPSVQKAAWNEQVSGMFGISREDFTAMGLNKLNVEEYGKILSWAYQRQDKAATDAREAGKKEALEGQVTFSCGPSHTGDSAPAKVKVLIEDNEGTSAELMSGVRQKLRSLSDVELVYERKQADLDVSILGYEEQVEGSTRRIGYTASTVVLAPCVGKIGTYEWEFQMFDDHYLLSVGTDINLLVGKVVAKLDSQDIESVRKSHAQWNSFRQKKN